MRGGPARRRGGGRGTGPLLPFKLARELGLPQAVRRGGMPPHRGRGGPPRGAGGGGGAGEVGCTLSSKSPQLCSGTVPCGSAKRAWLEFVSSCR